MDSACDEESHAGFALSRLRAARILRKAWLVPSDLVKGLLGHRSLNYKAEATATLPLTAIASSINAAAMSGSSAASICLR